MASYRDGYRDGLNVALLENAEDVYKAQCDAIDRKLVQLVAQIQRMPPSRCRLEMKQYIAQSKYRDGFREGYARARKCKRANDR